MRLSRLGTAWPAALAVLSGLALDLAFPSRGWWPLAPVAVAGLALATRGASPLRGAGLGALAGLAFFVPHLSWSGVYVGSLPWIALATLEAAYLGLLGAVLPLAWRVPWGRAGTVLTVAGLWVAQEALRGRTPFGGFPWGRIAFSQSDAPTLGYAALGGAALVSFAVAAAGACLAVATVDALAALRSARGSGRPGRLGRLRPALPARTVLPAGVAAGAALVVMTAGLAVPLPVEGSRTAQVAAVQGNVPAPGLDFNAQRRAVLDNHARATRDLGRRIDAGQAPRPDVVLWPENASDIDPLANADAGAVIDGAAAAVRAPILVGAVLNQPPDRLSNASIVWGPPGGAGGTPAGPGARYVKRHPAPFGEYIPFRSFFRRFSDKVDLVRRDFVAGEAVGVLQAGPVRVGDVICFEVAYDDLVQDTIRAGADLLVVQTNNATFGFTDESVQQLAMSRLRAVETGRAVVHISTVGVSALVAPDGSLQSRSGHFTQEVLQGRLPLRTGLTPAVRVGTLAELVPAGLALLLAAAAGVRTRRRRAGGAGGLGNAVHDHGRTTATRTAPALPVPSPPHDEPAHEEPAHEETEGVR